MLVWPVGQTVAERRDQSTPVLLKLLSSCCESSDDDTDRPENQTAICHLTLSQRAAILLNRKHNNFFTIPKLRRPFKTSLNVWTVLA
jgi:hypothetical protein